MTDRALLSAAAHAIRNQMKRRQVTEQAAILETDPSAWAPPDPELEALAVEIDEFITFICYELGPIETPTNARKPPPIRVDRGRCCQCGVTDISDGCQ